MSRDRSVCRHRVAAAGAITALALASLGVLAATPAEAVTAWVPGGSCGSLQSTTVPAGVYSMTVDLSGGNGGKGGGQSGGTTGTGGAGGRVVATFPVTPGDTISAVVGCNGADGDGGNSDVPTPTTAGWSRGGGTGQGSNTAFFPNGAGGGGGGGSSAVCVGASCAAGSGTPMVVAGGGGGSGSSSCSGTTGGPGGIGGTSGSTAAGGGTGPSGSVGGIGADSGQPSNGIPGGSGGVNIAGGSANGGSAPNGSGGAGVNVVGGAGGGGWVGGAAGANAATGCKAGGAGGGGSSWWRSTVTGTPTFQAGTGPSVKVTFANPVATAPWNVVATPGNNNAIVSWAAPATVSSPTLGYKVTPYVGTTPLATQTFASTATKQTVTGLTNGTTYTFKVQAYNAIGTGVLSAASNPVVVGAPGTPVLQTATPGDTEAKVSWWAPPSNGAPITSTFITPYVNGVAQTPYLFENGASSQILQRLTNGVTYTFKIMVTNSFGDSNTSGATAAITVGAPTNPTFASATPGDTTARISWQAPNANGSPLTNYIVTSYVGGVLKRTDTFPPTATTQMIPDLVNGTLYTFKVAATNARGTGPTSAATAAITVGAPAVPVLVQATPGDGSATVSWWPPAANASPVSKYTITPYINGEAQPAVTYNTGATALRVMNLINGLPYTFKVTAGNAVGTSAQSKASPQIVVGAPAKTTISSVVTGDASAKVTWAAAEPNAAALLSYVITPYLGSVAQTPQTFAPTALTQTLTGLTNGSAYTFRVAAVNRYGTAALSNASTAITVGVPSNPMLPSAIPGNGTAKVSWQAPASVNGGPVTGYTVTPYVGTVAQTPQTFASTLRTQTLTGLTNGTTYTFKVAATNAFGTGASSGASTAITVGTPVAPATPTVVGGVAQATVSWVAPADNGSAITGYVITPFMGGVAQDSITYASTATSQVLTGLVMGSSYTFRVSAINANGTSPRSNASAAVVPT